MPVIESKLDLRSDQFAPTMTDLPREWTTRFVSRSQRHLLKIYPAEPLTSAVAWQQFVLEVEGVDPLATGVPLRDFYAREEWQRSLVVAGFLAAITIGLVLYLFLQSWPRTCLALIPAAFVLLTLTGLRGWCRIEVANELWLIVPVLTGIAVSVGVQSVLEARHGVFTVKTASPGILANLLSSAVGIALSGSLLLGVASEWQASCQLLIFGLGFNLLAGTMFLPAGMLWLRQRAANSPEWEEALPAENVEPALRRPVRRIRTEGISSPV